IGQGRLRSRGLFFDSRSATAQTASIEGEVGQFIEAHGLQCRVRERITAPVIQCIVIDRAALLAGRNESLCKPFY
ncbi:UNVERIFIED_CONTAM: hypothetical protein ODX46_23000, partial [Salmonella enterica subsp. enterica serovar Enteritidis]